MILVQKKDALALDVRRAILALLSNLKPTCHPGISDFVLISTPRFRNFLSISNTIHLDNMEDTETLPPTHKRSLEGIDALDLAPSKRLKQNPPLTPESLPLTPPATRSRPLVYHCTFQNCNRSFSKPCRLTEHERSHTGERPFVCSLCQKTFGRDYHLSRHIQQSHNDKRDYPCSWEGCDKAFATPQRQAEHLKTHTKVKEFVCTGYGDCREVFRKKNTLARHIKDVHLNVQPYQCDKIDPATNEPCTYGYDTAGGLRYHTIIYHSGEPRYFCSVCKVASSGEIVDTSIEGTTMNENDVALGFKLYSEYTEHKRLVHPKISTREIPAKPKAPKPVKLSKPRRRNNQHSVAMESWENISAADLLTGAPTPLPEIQCFKPTCSLVFFNQHAMAEHCSKVHGMAEVEISERRLERASKDGNGKWYLGGLPGAYDDDDSDIDENEGAREAAGNLMSALKLVTQADEPRKSDYMDVDPALH